MFTSFHIDAAVWSTLEQIPETALRPPATGAALQLAQDAWGQALPAPLLEAYRRHNGQVPHGVALFCNEFRWLSIQEAVQEWQTWQTTMARPDMTAMRDSHASCGHPNAKVRMDWWNQNWWPLAVSDDADLLCLDGQPGPTGALHQIIIVSSVHEGRSLAAVSLANLFDQAAADLAGDFMDQD